MFRLLLNKAGLLSYSILETKTYAIYCNIYGCSLTLCYLIMTSIKNVSKKLYVEVMCPEIDSVHRNLLLTLHNECSKPR